MIGKKINKKGNLQDLFVIFAILFTVLIALFLVSKVGITLSQNLRPVLNQTAGSSDQVNNIFDKIDALPGILDAAMIMIFIGLVVALLIFVSRLNLPPVYAGIFLFIGGLVLIAVGVIFANMHEMFNDSTIISDASSQFVMANFIFSKLPFIVILILIVVAALIFSRNRVET